MLRARSEHLTRLLRRVLYRPSVDRALRGLPWIAGLLFVEMLGRTSTSDALDAIGVLLLGLLLKVHLAQHPAAWRRLRRRGKALLLRARISFSLDMRETPPIEPGLPPGPKTVLLAGAILTGGAVVARNVLPGVVRDVLRHASGLLAIAFTGLLWSVLLVGLFAFVVGLVIAVHQTWGVRAPARSRPWREAVAGGALLGLAALGFGLAPPVAALALLGTALAAYAIASSLFVRDPILLWRRQGSRDRPRALRTGTAQAAFALFGALCIALPTLLAAGDRFQGAGEGTTAFTATLGLV